MNSVLGDTPVVPAPLWRRFRRGSTLSPTKKRRLSAMQRKKRFYCVNYLAARAGWDSTVLYRQERLILMSGEAWRLLLARLLPSCCTSPSSCSHRKLWNRLLGSNLDSCCRMVALTHTEGASGWSATRVGPLNMHKHKMSVYSRSLYDMNRHLHGSRGRNCRWRDLSVVMWDKNLVGVDVFTQSRSKSVSNLCISIRLTDGTVLKTDRSATRFCLKHSWTRH